MPCVNVVCGFIVHETGMARTAQCHVSNIILIFYTKHYIKQTNKPQNGFWFFIMSMVAFSANELMCPYACVYVFGSMLFTRSSKTVMQML